MTAQANRRPYIIVEGAIGVGKTTLARMLSEHFGSGLLLEVFEENPFLAKFYQSRTLYAFQTQMFFLLSRYRQQQQVPLLLEGGSLISDYMFDKDRLFAQLNLTGDEWEIYQQIHAALADQIVTPDLVVYLQADTDVLMGRISQRDRPYERTMDRDYIEELRRAYEQFFPTECSAPVLQVDTNEMNFVTNPADFQSIVDRIRSFLAGVFQPALPFPSTEDTGSRKDVGRPPSMTARRFHGELDRVVESHTDLYFNYLRLSEEMGELSRVLAEIWRMEAEIRQQGHTEGQARLLALHPARQALEAELVDCLANILRMASSAGINLERAFQVDRPTQ